MRMTETVVALPGLGFDASVWSVLADVFSDQYALIPQALPNELMSDLSETASSWLAYFDAVLPERCHLLGWSLGGNVAWMLAEKWPDRFVSVATLSSNPCFLQQGNWPGITRDLWSPFLNQDSGVVSVIAKRFLRLQGARAIQQKMKAFQLSAPYPGWWQGLQLLGELDARDFLKGTAVPMWLGFGEKDGLLPSAVSEAVQSLSSALEIKVFTDAPHASFYDQPECIARALENFWSGCEY